MLWLWVLFCVFLKIIDLVIAPVCEHTKKLPIFGKGWFSIFEFPTVHSLCPPPPPSPHPPSFCINICLQILYYQVHLHTITYTKIWQQADCIGGGGGGGGGEGKRIVSSSKEQLIGGKYLLFPLKRGLFVFLKSRWYVLYVECIRQWFLPQWRSTCSWKIIIDTL